MAVRFEIPVLAVAAVLLLAIHSDANYFGPTPEEPDATFITFGSRVLFGALLLAAWVLAQTAPRLAQRTGDADYLATAAIPPRADALWRTDQVTLSAVPLALFGVGLLLPPLEFGAAGDVVALAAAWLAWLWAVAQGAGFFSAQGVEAVWGPGGAGGVVGRLSRFVLIPLAAGTYYLTRETVALSLDPRGALSMWVTALAGLLLGVLCRQAIRRSAEGIARRQGVLREYGWIVERKRRSQRAARARLGAGANPGSARVWWAKDVRVILRTPALRWLWAAVLALKVLGLWLAVQPASTLPWAFSGLLLVLGDVLAGNAILQMWGREQVGWSWGAPSSRRAQWWARVGPPLFASLAASAALVAWAEAVAGPQVARPLALWLLVSGVSLVVAAGNLGISSPPQTALGQNLYALGLLSALVVSAVYPVVGWAVLGLFALYTLRALTLDPRG